VHNAHICNLLFYVSVEMREMQHLFLIIRNRKNVVSRCRAAEIGIDAKGINITSKAAFEIKGSLPAALIKILLVLLCAYKNYF